MPDRHGDPESSQNSPHDLIDEQAQECVTALLGQWRKGDDAALSEVIERLYSELKRLAGAYLRGRDANATIGPTALVHEFYLRAGALRGVDWQSRGQFIAAAARAMRNLLIDRARRRLSEKHGGDRIESLQDQDAVTPNIDTEILAVHEGLDRLTLDYPRHAQVVELIFFGGLSLAETADAMGISQRTVERDWKLARAWLRAFMGTTAS
ncbi:MAG: sigma-70 family RNA polymerase sigma factor [Acidobacteriota bacterium]|nr:sigma-70 family RNA polymerase sigma factor [Acidobacteriota bacterium]